MSKFVIAFVLTYIGGIAATILMDVSWGIYLYQLQYFLNPSSRWWYGHGHLPHLRYSFIIAVIIFVSFIFKIKQYSENRLFDVPQTKWLLAFMVMMFIVSFYAVWPEVHDAFLINHFKLMIFLVVAYKVIDTPEKFEKMIWVYLLGNFYVGWVSHSLGRTGFGRLEGTGPADTGGDGNSTAAILMTAVPILIFYIIKGKLWQRVLSLFMLAFIMDAIILINSRGAFLGLVIALTYMMAFFVFFNKKVKAKERIKLMGMIVAGICLFVYLTDATFWERMGTIKGEASVEKGAGGRKFFWMKTFDLVEQHPFGVGGWGYQYLSHEFLPDEMLTNGSVGLRRRAVHSIYFQCFAEYGYPGIPIFGGLLLSTFLFMRKSKRYLFNKGKFLLYYQGIAIESGLVGYLTSAIFLSLLYPEILYWFILFTACFGNIYMLKDRGLDKMAALDKEQRFRA